jgi:N utilization substance protein B
LGRRHQARELALRVLFELENEPAEPEEALSYQAEEDGAAADVVDFARELVQGVVANQEQLDREIADASRNWKLEQMSKVDRVILRIAIYEIAVSRRVPVKAAINESIELAKTFSGEESGRFVNGVLGRVAASLAS